MFDIITFGSATLDIFLKPKLVQKVSDKGKFITGRGMCFSVGSKIEIEEIYFASGGGGTNTAATFVNQGFSVAYYGVVGQDLAGQAIINELNNLGIDTQFVSRTNKKPTNHSIILTGLKEDRTALVYRGASEFLEKKDIFLKKIKNCLKKEGWLYIAPLSGRLCQNFELLVNFAFKNKIKVAVNPGNCQIFLPAKILKEILKKIDILILNQEEASLLTRVPYQKEKEIFRKFDRLGGGIVIMTRGEKEVIVSDKKYIYKAKPPKIKITDKTGAGDAFSAGFVSGFIQSNGDVEYAIQLGTVNAVSCIQNFGAKKGLVKKKKKFFKVRVIKLPYGV